METLLTYTLLSFFLSMLMAPLLIGTLYRYNIVRKVEKDFSTLIDERYHKAGTPIMGGLLVVIMTLLMVSLFNLNGVTIVPMIVLAISAALGGVDDLLNIFGRKRVVRTIRKQIMLAKVHKSFLYRIYYWLSLPWAAYKNVWYALGSYPGSGIHAGEKIIVQLIASLLVVWWIYGRLGWDTIWFPFIGTLDLGVLMPIYIVFTILSMTNAVNIADGMDGLSSGTLIASFTAFMVLANLRGNTELALLCAVVVGSLLAYLYFNIKPARFQMGDVGSLSLGILLATVAFALDRSILLVVIGFPYVLEIGSSLMQAVFRRVFGRRLLKMAPLHLHFQIIGWSEEKTVMRFWLLAILCALVGLLISSW